MPDPFAQQTIPSTAPRYHQGRKMFGGRYTLLRPLGRGGMGEVWLSQDNELGVQRALKFAPPEVAADARSVAILKREAIAGTSLAHPNIVRIFDFAHDAAAMESAVVMEVVEGKSLAELQAQRIEESGNGFFEPEEIERWLRDACAALEYAHGEGRAHRDLKPQNFMVEIASGRLKIMDFGISRRIGDSFNQLTGKDSSGTLPYMSPQQVMGEPPVASDDIYGLGATLYDLLTGSPPFIGGALEAQVREKRPSPVMARRAEVNASSGKPVAKAWEDLVMACLEKEREKRPESAGVLWQSLQAPAKAVPTLSSSPPPIPDRTPLSAELASATASDTQREQRTQKPQAPLKATPSFSPPARPAATKPTSMSQAAAAAVQRPHRVKPMIALAAALFMGGVGLWAIVSKPKEEASKFVEDTASQQEAEQQRQRADALGKLEREEQQKRLAIEAAAATANKDAGRAAGPPAAASVSTSSNPPKTTALGGPRALPATATKDEPFVNSLGMKFVPVPIGAGPSAGQRLLFGIWETRSKDYAVFMKSGSYTMSPSPWNIFSGLSGTDADAWRTSEYEGVPIGRGEGERAEESSHPVVYVSWEDATAFAQWLTLHERGAGRIGPRDEYRLPTDVEWSYAVGIGDQESASASPKEKHNGLPEEFPWGGNYPPPGRAGNYRISEYTDGYATTAPVGSFVANFYGLHDLGGNVWEWCQDWHDDDQKYRVLRGGSWKDEGLLRGIRSAHRYLQGPSNRGAIFGFRCVLVVAGG